MRRWHFNSINIARAWRKATWHNLSLSIINAPRCARLLFAA